MIIFYLNLNLNLKHDATVHGANLNADQDLNSKWIGIGHRKIMENKQAKTQ